MGLWSGSIKGIFVCEEHMLGMFRVQFQMDGDVKDLIPDEPRKAATSLCVHLCGKTCYIKNVADWPVECIDTF